jgi:hypothetical protein
VSVDGNEYLHTSGSEIVLSFDMVAVKDYGHQKKTEYIAIILLTLVDFNNYRLMRIAPETVQLITYTS